MCLSLFLSIQIVEDTRTDTWSLFQQLGVCSMMPWKSYKCDHFYLYSTICASVLPSVQWLGEQQSNVINARYHRPHSEVGLLTYCC